MKDGLKLRLLRHRAGQDQYQLAHQLNIPVASYSRIECGLERLEGQLAKRILQIYGLNAEEFAQYKAQISF